MHASAPVYPERGIPLREDGVTEVRPRRFGPREFLTAPVAPRTWRELLYLIVRAPIGTAAFALTLAFGTASALLVITFLGLPLLAVLVLSGRLWTRMFGWLSRVFLRSAIEAPIPFVGHGGFLGWLRSALRDTPGWRGLGYILVSFPLMIAGSYAVLIVWAMTFTTLTYVLWWALFDPESGGYHSGLQLGSWHADSWPRALLVSAVGLAALFLIAPWVTRGVAAVDRLLIRVFLRPSRRDARVAQLERTRTVAVEGGAATLRRVERDLHDGTQAQLVALAMNISRARAKLEAGEAGDARRLLDTAHESAKDTLAGLRDVVRGIHPPSLDRGLIDALATLTSRNAIPTELRGRVERRLSPGVETIAYFCVAELLSNVNRHTRARHATVDLLDLVDVSRAPAALRIQVHDDGIGGAHLAAPGADGSGTGLSGLAERVSTIDGTLTVDSPPGGPTTVSVTLPTV